ncbi:MAG: RNA methyltransferase [Bacteroidales bacterium]|nr:RNA methyltransferase [Bacteroidales bacterium]
MLSKAKIKHIQSLKLNKFRKQHQSFIAEGSTNVLDFINSRARVLEVYATEAWTKKHEAVLKGVSVEVVNATDMERISALKHASEVLAVIQIPQHRLPKEIDGYVLALDDIRDPGNLGTIIRTADWFGIRDILCSPETVDAYNPKVVQATMGSLARVRVHYTPLADYFERKNDIPIFGALLDGEDIRKTEKQGTGILLMGSEAQGISKALYPFIHHRIRIPSAENNGAESLNAAVATALVCAFFVMTD